MKKIYTLASALALSVVTLAQNQGLYDFGSSSKLLPYNFTKNINHKSVQQNKIQAAGPFSLRVDPMYNLFTNNSTPGTIGSEIAIFYTELFCDSLVTFKYTSGLSHIGTHMAGIVFDPQSISQDPSFTPLVSKVDSYTIDSLYFGGVYKRVTNATVVDTLFVDVVWGDTTATTVFNKYAFPSTSPLGKFGSLITPRFSVASTTLSGVQAKLSAPAANYIRYKVALNESDSNRVNNISGYLSYGLPSALTIPAKARVSVCYTFKPGSTYTLGTVGFGDATNPATINGWAPTLYSQSPQPTTSAAILDYFNDINDGKNIGVVMYSNQRYGTIASGFVQTSALYNQFAQGYMIDLHISGNSTVGIDELEANGAALGQNVPNPFTSESSVAYELTKGANVVTFAVTDVMGRVISTEKVANAIGKHNVKLGTYAAGVYYYTLTVDGKSATKKMIVQ